MYEQNRVAVIGAGAAGMMAAIYAAQNGALVTVFEKNEGKDTYSRRDEIQSERCYSKNEIKIALEKCGFEVVGFYSDFDFSPSNDTNERWYIVAKAKK